MNMIVYKTDKTGMGNKRFAQYKSGHNLQARSVSSQSF